MNAGKLFSNIGMGLAAGLVGTAAITISQLIEMKLRGRAPSDAPAKAVENVFDLKPDDEKAEARLAQAVHWGYGTTWGAVRGVLGGALPSAAASAAHFGAVQTAAMVMLPRLKVAPPVREWGAKELGIEMLHHAVYAAAAGATYDALSRNLAKGARFRMPWELIVGALAATGLRRKQGIRGLLARDHSIADRARHAMHNLAGADLRETVAYAARYIKDHAHA